MTHPTPKDPQAEELKDVLWRIGAFDLLDHDQHVELQKYFQAHQQELLSDLLKKKVLHAVKPGKKYYAVPVSVINSKIGELNG